MFEYLGQLYLVGILKLIDQHVFDRIGRNNAGLHQIQRLAETSYN